MSLPSRLYSWKDANANPIRYYTDNTAIYVGMPLYNNQGTDTGRTIGFIQNNTFDVACTLTINPTPSDATVTLTASGYTQSGNSITVRTGTNVNYTVSKTGYATQSNVISVTNNQSLAISLNINYYTLTINPTPNNATVTFSTGTVSGNTVSVPYNTTVNYTVSKNGYVSASGSRTLTSNISVSVPLNAKLPGGLPEPTSYSTTLLQTASGDEYKTYDITADGWYAIEVMSAGSMLSRDWVNGHPGGYKYYVTYLYANTRCLLWGSTYGTTPVNWSDMGQNGKTGYPSPTDYWGGTGAVGHDESGGGGGGAANNGRHACHIDASNGAGGSGFLAGKLDNYIQNSTINRSGWSRSFSSENTFSVSNVSLGHLYVALLCGGAGGPGGSNGDNRCAGGAGGAYGNGGDVAVWVQTAKTDGPGGSWGAGNTGPRYSNGTDGSWCVIDLSKNFSDCGSGGGQIQTNGYCKLYKVNT